MENFILSFLFCHDLVFYNKIPELIDYPVIRFNDLTIQQFTSTQFTDYYIFQDYI